MKPFRVIMMLAALLATATAVNAQTPPVQCETAQPASSYIRIGFSGGLPVQWVVPSCPQAGLPRFHADFNPGAAVQTCPVPNTPAWHAQMIQQTAAAWQRLHAMAGAGKQEAGCCEANRVKNLPYPLVNVVQVAQPPKACCCVKACACCETCKAKKDTQVQAVPMTQSQVIRMMQRLNVFTTPACGDDLPACMPPAHGIGVVQVVPVQGGRIVQGMPVAHQVRAVHFATPELDAHCERMQHQGDTVVLEGNVVLLVKKHVQPIRVEAQRVIVNMKDGSFTVDSQIRTVPATSFGVQRTTVVPPTMMPFPTFDIKVAPAANKVQWVPGTVFELPVPANDRIRVIGTPGIQIVPPPPPLPQGCETPNCDELFRLLMKYYR